MRAHEREDGSFVWEDEVTHDEWTIEAGQTGVVEIIGDAITVDMLWIRASDCAALGEWLIKNYGDVDWRPAKSPTLDAEREFLRTLTKPTLRREALDAAISNRYPGWRAVYRQRIERALGELAGPRLFVMVHAKADR